MAFKKEESRKDNFFGIIILCAVVLLGLATVFCRLENNRKINFADRSAYRAVFLDNGEVYFGQLQKSYGNYLRLNNVYYFKVGQVVDENIQPDVQLMKLGNEIHQPKNYLDINREHILFIQELASDSKILPLMKNFDQIKASATQNQKPAETLPTEENVTTTEETTEIPAE